MKQITRTLLNVMRIEVLLGIGLVLWVFSLEVRAEEPAPKTEAAQISGKEANFQKHYELNSFYGQCIHSKVISLGE